MSTNDSQMRGSGSMEWSPFGEADANDPDAQVRRRFFGKYRGTVVDNDDSLSMARLRVSVPDVFANSTSSWAMPCVPLTGPMAGTYVRPPIGADIWVEFEQGDPQMPIWVGGFWASGEVPEVATQAATEVPGSNPIITLETPTASLSICDIAIGEFGNVCIRFGPDTMIALDSAGIRMLAPKVDITAPEIEMTGDVTINGVTTANGDVTIVGATELTGDVTALGAASVEGALDSLGAVTIGGAVDIAGAVNIVGNAIIGGLLNGLPPI